MATALVTSGTVASDNWTVERCIAHAFRRAKIPPAKVGGEMLDVARQLMGGIMNEYVNAGFPLWTRQFILLGATIGSPDVTTPLGTVDVLHAYWRILQPYRGTGVTLSSGGNGATLFSGQPGADVTITGANPTVTVSFGSPTETDTIGVLLGGSAPITAALQVLISSDGSTFTLAQTLPSTTFAPGQWAYFDLNPTLTAPYLRLEYVSVAGPWVLNQLNFGLANGQDILIGPNNIDQYYNLPNKQFQSTQATTAFVDRQLNSPVIKIWPTVNATGFYNGCISALTRRYIQDLGALSNNPEFPQRGWEALTWRLAAKLIFEYDPPNAADQQSYFAMVSRTQLIDLVDKQATKAESMFWAEERSGGPLQWAPNTSCYTR